MAVTGTARPADADAAIAAMAGRIASRFRPDQIVLFGSRARGDARKDSDVDLLVVMPNGTDQHEAEVAMYMALRDAPLPKDIIVATPDDVKDPRALAGTVLQAALRDGIVLHERG